MRGAMRIRRLIRRRPSRRRLLPLRGRREEIHPRHASMAEHILATHAVRLGFRQILGAREEEMRSS